MLMQLLPSSHLEKHWCEGNSATLEAPSPILTHTEINFWFLLWSLNLGVSGMLGKHSPTELYLQTPEVSWASKPRYLVEKLGTETHEEQSFKISSEFVS